MGDTGLSGTEGCIDISFSVFNVSVTSPRCGRRFIGLIGFHSMRPLGDGKLGCDILYLYAEMGMSVWTIAWERDHVHNRTHLKYWTLVVQSQSFGTCRGC